MAAFIKRYQEIATRQEAVKKVADAVDPHIDAFQASRLLNKQIKEQDLLIEEINKLSASDKLKEYEVVIWVNSQIIDAMTASKNMMGKGLAGPALAMAQQTSIDRINDIINALKEEKNKKDEFNKPNEGGEGKPGGGKPPLIPPLAQLKLLKAMQTVINTNTKMDSKQLENVSDPKQQNEIKQQVNKLGDQQGKIKDITDGIIKKMQQ